MDRTTKALVTLTITLCISSCVSNTRKVTYTSVPPPPKRNNIEPVITEDVPIYKDEDFSLDEAEKQVVLNNTIPGYAKVNNLNIRAGGNLNYEVITQLNRGDKVAILEEQYVWYKILLPEDCLGWVYANYVFIPQREKKLTSEKETHGIVTGDMVRVRVKPRLNSTVLLQMDRGYKVIVVGRKENWFRIKLPLGCTGWVKSDFIEKK